MLTGAEVREDRGRRLPEGGGVAVHRTGQGAEDEDVYVPFKPKLRLVRGLVFA